MPRKFTRWGGVKINTSKTPRQLVEQLNNSDRESLRDYASVDSANRVTENDVRIMHSTAAKRYGIEYDRDADRWILNKKGSMSENAPLSSIGGTNG